MLETFRGKTLGMGIRFKKIEDVDLKALEKVLKLAARDPGFN